MKTASSSRALVLVLLFVTTASAKDPHFYQHGTIAQMDSVACGHDENSGQGLTGVLLGTDSSKTKVRETLCQEYTLHTERVVYRIRPREEKHAALLPVGETASFRIKRDRMLLRVQEMDDKEREYSVVSMKPLGEQQK
jgi:hypothetical protein